ncbi:MAG: hypothetical protein P8L68_04835 [Paracoccaceae bacterium]|nr:hypothetical protein [Paracoccaceae bacterium]MDG2257803.1 hypothetical protein [Paracoccaceae bacterium]
MKICILHIGHTEPGAVSAHPPSPERFKAGLAPYLPHADWTTISAVTGTLPQPEDYNAYLITGGKYSVFDTLAWQDRFLDFIGDVISKNIQIIGICYGHQAIAQVLGGVVERSPRGYGVGLMPVSVVADTSWCQSSEDPLMLHAMHQDQVTVLPEGAEVFLSSDFCPISGFTFNNNVLAIQQHPDFTCDLNYDLIKKREDRIGEKTAIAAIAALEGRDDTAASVEWMARFLRQQYVLCKS